MNFLLAQVKTVTYVWMTKLLAEFCAYCGILSMEVHLRSILR
uniref:Uncharacterized protein n=1 Tax=Arundo donax TaxID=35708 RepID=A0A0A9FHD9_ARUDO